MSKTITISAKGYELDESMRNHERSMAIIMDSVLNSTVKMILMQNFKNKGKEVKQLFDPNQNGPLSSLTSKARLAYALNLIEVNIFKDLKYIHMIRNRCAHDVFLTFGENKILDLVGKLSIVPNGKTITKQNSFDFL